jgi:hypothetical protein
MFRQKADELVKETEGKGWEAEHHAQNMLQKAMCE